MLPSVGIDVRIKAVMPMAMAAARIELLMILFTLRYCDIIDGGLAVICAKDRFDMLAVIVWQAVRQVTVWGCPACVSVNSQKVARVSIGRTGQTRYYVKNTEMAGCIFHGVSLPSMHHI